MAVQQPKKLEQHYFDLFHPTLNILTTAGSSLGSSHPDATKAKMALSSPKRIPVRITNTIEAWSKDYISIGAAARDLNLI